MAADFEAGNHRDLSQFLEHMEAMKERGLITTAAAGASTVSIMSIHKSKGLEFPVVFLCNLSRKFNQEDLRGQILCDKELGLGLSVTDMERCTLCMVLMLLIRFFSSAILAVSPACR